MYFPVDIMWVSRYKGALLARYFRFRDKISRNWAHNFIVQYIDQLASRRLATLVKLAPPAEVNAHRDTARSSWGPDSEKSCPGNIRRGSSQPISVMFSRYVHLRATNCRDNFQTQRVVRVSWHDVRTATNEFCTADCTVRDDLFWAVSRQISIGSRRSWHCSRAGGTSFLWCQDRHISIEIRPETVGIGRSAWEKQKKTFVNAGTTGSVYTP